MLGLHIAQICHISFLRVQLLNFFRRHPKQDAEMVCFNNNSRLLAHANVCLNQNSCQLGGFWFTGRTDEGLWVEMLLRFLDRMKSILISLANQNQELPVIECSVTSHKILYSRRIGWVFRKVYTRYQHTNVAVANFLFIIILLRTPPVPMNRIKKRR